MKNKDFKAYIECDCTAEILAIEPQDIEFPEEGLYFSLFEQAYNKKSFWNRFRHIIYILKNGTPYTDQICLDFDKVKNLNKYLDNYIALTELTIKQRNKYKKK